MPRKLRIAVSVFFGLVAVALCVLWVRSYHFADTIYPSAAIITSEQGEINVSLDSDRTQTSQWIYIRPVVPWNPSNKSYLSKPSPQFLWQHSRNRFHVRFPHWSVLVVAASLAFAPWLSLRRFSLRTLLIATTLIALVLGLAAWAAR